MQCMDNDAHSGVHTLVRKSKATLGMPPSNALQLTFGQSGSTQLDGLCVSM